MTTGYIIYNAIFITYLINGSFEQILNDIKWIFCYLL
jgi:hypothetical protein